MHSEAQARLDHGPPKGPLFFQFDHLFCWEPNMKYMLSIKIKNKKTKRGKGGGGGRGMKRQTYRGKTQKQHEDLPRKHIYFHPYPINHDTLHHKSIHA